MPDNASLLQSRYPIPSKNAAVLAASKGVGREQEKKYTAKEVRDCINEIPLIQGQLQEQYVASLKIP